MGRRLPSSRSSLFALAVVAAFAAGVLSQRIRMPEAHADTTSSTATVYVPSEGLVFRTLDGTPIARISRDSRGGVFELYDEQQRPARRSLSSAAPAATLGPSIATDVGLPVARDPGF
jgi:hypothetical protein